jgi:hypothetical protein
MFEAKIKQAALFRKVRFRSPLLCHETWDVFLARKSTYRFDDHS